MAYLAEASAILIAFGAEVEGVDWRVGMLGIGGIIAGDGFAFRGF
jgi:hypothetical protein